LRACQRILHKNLLQRLITASIVAQERAQIKID
jgi:hypothetical protein